MPLTQSCSRVVMTAELQEQEICALRNGTGILQSLLKLYAKLNMINGLNELQRFQATRSQKQNPNHKVGKINFTYISQLQA